MSIRDHRIVTIDTLVTWKDNTKTNESYTGIFPNEEYAKLWVQQYLKSSKSYEIIAVRTIVPIACVIAHSW